MTIAEGIYLLCALTSLAAAVLLLRHYRAGRSPLLLWSCIAFFGLALNNVLVYTDLVLIAGIDFQLLRTAISAGAMLILVYGLIKEAGA